MNNFLPPDASPKSEQRFPLTVGVCETCSFVQSGEVVNPKILFLQNYSYYTGASAPLVAHLREFAETIARRFVTSPEDLVVEFGSNDGSFLHPLLEHAKVLGVDPAQKIAAAATASGVKTLPVYFNETTAKAIRRRSGPAKVIAASNVFAHINDLDSVLRGVAALLADDGVLAIETHWVYDLITHGGFDQIYHEHVSYFGLAPLERLFGRFGLEVIDVSPVPIHGQSLRVFATKRNMRAGDRNPTAIDAVRRVEAEAKLDTIETYLAFGTTIARRRDLLVSMLRDLKASGKRVFGYGAPAKAVIMLNFCGIDADLIEAVTDTTLAKQGMLIPGVHILVRAPEYALQNHPDYYVLFAWNYQDAILAKEKAFRERGGKFIIPIPEPRIV